MYQYYSVMRPISIGTFPGKPVKIVHFETRSVVENGRYLAWGVLSYESPLSEKEQCEYELSPAISNPDLAKNVGCWTQIVGYEEDRRKVRESSRYTWYYSDFGMYVLKDWVRPDDLKRRYSLSIDMEMKRWQPVLNDILAMLSPGNVFEMKPKELLSLVLQFCVKYKLARSQVKVCVCDGFLYINKIAVGRIASSIPKCSCVSEEADYRESCCIDDVE